MVLSNPTAPDSAADLLRCASAFEGFDDAQLSEVVSLLQPQRLAAGETIVREGESAQHWYVIADGSAAVTRVDLTGQTVTLAVLGPGDCFGERALLPGHQRRDATVHALTDIHVFTLARTDVETRLSAAQAFRDRLTRRLELLAIDAALKRASPFAPLPHSAIWSLAQQVQSRPARAGEVIVRQGEPGDAFYLIRTGRVEVVRDKRRVAVLGAGDSFGEVALLSATSRTATVRALEDTQLLVLDREVFQLVAREHASIANHFRELVGVRFRGSAGQHLLLPDPLTTIMPLVAPGRRKRYWRVLAAGVVLFALLTALAHQLDNPPVAYAVLAVGSLLGPIVFVLYLAESNILAERPRELIATALLGAALGLPPAMWLQREGGILPGSLASATLIAIIEEPAKVLGVLWLLGRPALRFRMDGVIYGAAAGMGFAAFETALYGLARVDTIGVLLGVLWLRALLSPFTHGTWTAIVCATIWRARTRGWWAATWRSAAALGVAVGLHTLWNWQVLAVPGNFAQLVLVGVAGILVLRAVLQRAAQEEAHAVVAFAPEAARAAPGTPGLRCDGCGWRAPGGARYCPRCGLALRRHSLAS